MVLEFLLEYEWDKPLQVFASGFFFSSVAIFIAAALFTHSPSLVVVTFMTLPLVYVYTKLLENEAQHEARVKTIHQLVADNIFLAKTYLMLFLGMTVGIAFWFSILPNSMLSSLFSEQIFNLNQIGVVTGLYIITSAIDSSNFMTIASNNIKLVLLSGIMSFVFAAGALFILSWNASVVGVAVGSIIIKLMGAGASNVTALSQGIGLGTVYYILHVIPEVVAYFLAAVSGAFISSAMMRYKPFSPNSNRLLAISGALVIFAVALILLGAVIEIQISHQLQNTYRV